jgi:hypothetical protein
MEHLFFIESYDRTAKAWATLAEIWATSSTSAVQAARNRGITMPVGSRVRRAD